MAGLPGSLAKREEKKLKDGKSARSLQDERPIKPYADSKNRENEAED